MRKHLLWLPVIVVVVVTTAFQHQVKELVLPEQPINKNIHLAVYADSNYTSKAYEKTAAKVEVTVTKVRGSKSTIVWNKTFDSKQLKDYPATKDAITQQISIPNVFDKKERIVVTYKLTYDSKGSILQMESNEEISRGKQSDNLYIKI